VEGLVSAGVKPLRVGFGGNVRASLLEHTLDHKLQAHPLQPSMGNTVKREEELTERIKDLEQRLGLIQNNTTASLIKRAANMQVALVQMEREHGALKSRIYAMKQEMLRDVVTDADVVCRTKLLIPRRTDSPHRVDLHDVYHICVRRPERDRLPCRLFGRGFDVDRTSFFDSHHERRKKGQFKCLLLAHVSCCLFSLAT
jgi:hypothetical protein